MSKQNEAPYIGKIPLNWLKIPINVSNWETYETEDIFTTNLITIPNDYLLTLASGIHTSYEGLFSSLATTPAYSLKTSSQMYVAGRDVIRWGGPKDPYEIDFDRYIFTPLKGEDFAAVSKAPKSEPHHLSDVPELIKSVPDDWKEIFKAVQRGEFR